MNLKTPVSPQKHERREKINMFCCFNHSPFGWRSATWHLFEYFVLFASLRVAYGFRRSNDFSRM